MNNSPDLDKIIHDLLDQITIEDSPNNRTYNVIKVYLWLKKNGFINEVPNE